MEKKMNLKKRWRPVVQRKKKLMQKKDNIKAGKNEGKKARARETERGKK